METTATDLVIVESTKDNTTSVEGCPQCHMEPRHIVKQGPCYRRAKDKGKLAKVQMYQCTRCGYKARGNAFHMTEEMGKEKSNEAEMIVVESVNQNVPNTA
jgi:hypothetical protein